MIKSLSYEKIFVPISIIIHLLFCNLTFASCPPGFKAPKNNNVEISICGDEYVSNASLKHASSVLLKIIDFNEDNIPDNIKVVEELVDSGATYLVISEDSYENKYLAVSGNDAFTIVYQDEMVTDGKEFDPTLEEALHLVTQYGFVNLYPSKFGDYRGSEISRLMDKARGGYFKVVPKKYPPTAFYSYYDKTCDYGCQITEFTYWAITSLRNQQTGIERYQNIKDEWKLNSRDKIEKLFPELLSFFSRAEFGIILNDF